MVARAEVPASRAVVTVNIGGEHLGVPFLTRPMLDLWVHALHGPDPFLIVKRPDDPKRFIQTYRLGPGRYALERWHDGDRVSVEVPTAATVVDLMWDWIQGDWTGFDRLAGQSTHR